MNRTVPLFLSFMFCLAGCKSDPKSASIKEDTVTTSDKEALVLSCGTARYNCNERWANNAKCQTRYDMCMANTDDADKHELSCRFVAYECRQSLNPSDDAKGLSACNGTYNSCIKTQNPQETRELKCHVDQFTCERPCDPTKTTPCRVACQDTFTKCIADVGTVVTTSGDDARDTVYLTAEFNCKSRCQDQACVDACTAKRVACLSAK